MWKKNLTLFAVALVSCAYAATGLAADPDPSASSDDVAGTTIGGVAWFDFSSISLQNQNSKGEYVDTAPDGTGFDVKRFYFIVNHRFDDIWSADLTTDAQYSTSSTSTVTTPTGTTSALTNQNTSGGVTEVYIKKLYLQGQFDPRFVVRVGSADLPWIPFVEGVEGYRWIDKMPLDRLGLGTTADWGLHASGTFGPNLLSYALSAVDGGGYKNPTRTEDVDVEGRLSSNPVPWLTLGAGFYEGHLGQVTAANENFPTNTATRLDGLVAVKIVGLRVGFEYFDAKNYKTVNSLAASSYGTSSIVTTTGAAPVSDDADGGMVFASYDFTRQWAVFGRYDDAKLSKYVAPNLQDKYVQAGVAYKPIDPLAVALVYKNERVYNGSTSLSGFDANGSVTIGGATEAYSGRYNEGGVYFSLSY